MSHNPNDRLVSFIRQNAPSPPPEKVDVEEALMAQIERESETEKVIPFPQRHPQQWLFGGVVAASILLLFTSVRVLQPTPSSPQETAELEAFLTENWEALTTPSPSYTSWDNLTAEQPESSN